MKNKIFTLFLVIIVTTACTKITQVKVTYETTKAISEYNLQYMTPDGNLEKATIEPQSAQDIWRYSYLANEGDIVYVSGNYRDINSALKIVIKVDGKIYKQAANEADTLSFLIVSGVVPYK
jgi:hypothetical protein